MGSLFSNNCFLIGMVHLGPLLEGSQVPDLAEVEAKAIADAVQLTEAGFDAILFENLGDAPYYPQRVPPHTIAAMTRIGLAIRNAIHSITPKIPYIGVNVLRNDAEAAIAIAAAVGASFIRVNIHNGVMLTDQGIIQGQAHLTCRYRDRYHPHCAILADLRVKHAVPLAERPLDTEAADLWQRARADALILTGDQTGQSLDFDKLQYLRHRLPSCPLIAGSGVSPDIIPTIHPYINGAIIGTWLKHNGCLHNAIDPQRAKQLVSLVRKLDLTSPRL
jgi:hypothetical protein